MAAVSGQTSPWLPLSTDAPSALRATPTSYSPARRGAASFCWGAFPARRDEALQGALGVGGDGRGCERVGRSGGVSGLWLAPRLPSRALTFLWRRVAHR